MATSTLHSIHVYPETDFGMTPASPSPPAPNSGDADSSLEMAAVRHTATTLALTKSSNISEEIRADRQVSDFRHGTKQVGGDISFELSHGSFDMLLEAALGGTWASDVLKVGSTRRSFSFLRTFGDLTDGKYQLFTGAEINNLSLTVPLEGAVTGSFSIIGKDMTVSNAPPANYRFAAPNGNRLMDSFSGEIEEGGNAIATVTAIDFTLENGLNPKFVIGDETVNDNATIGRSNVSGNVTAYFEDATLLNKFVNETVTALKFSLQDPTGNELEFHFPEVIYSGAQTDTQGTTGEITVVLPFQAVLDTTEASNLVITRDAA